MRVFRSLVDGCEHLVFEKGNVNSEKPIMTRVHVEDSLKDIFQFLKTGENHLVQALQQLNKESEGVLILLRRAGKSSILSEAKALQGLSEEQWASGKYMDEKDYGIGAQILNHLGVRQIRLLSSRPERRVGLKAFGVEIVEIVPFEFLRFDQGEKIEKKEIESGRSYSSVQ